jgi:hypothetical protein
MTLWCANSVIYLPSEHDGRAAPEFRRGSFKLFRGKKFAGRRGGGQFRACFDNRLDNLTTYGRQKSP